MLIRDSRSRLDALRKLLREGELATQEELREKLEKLGFAVTQSTVSRDLRKVGSVKAIDNEGQTVYRLPSEFEPPVSHSLPDLIVDIRTNGSMIVIHTAVGSAPLVARHLDRLPRGTLLGTLAGDDTIFVAPVSTNEKEIRSAIASIRETLTQLS